MGDLFPRLARGAAAGVAGTAGLSATIIAARAARKIPVSAPHEISWRFEEKSGVPTGLTWSLGHIAYGASAGALFGALRPLLPLPAPIAGTLYGLAVWAGSYLFLMPRLGLYPPADWDKPSRRRVMIVGHALYGLCLGLLAVR